MEEKLKKVNETMKLLQSLETQKEDLELIRNAMERKDKGELYCELHLGGASFSLSDLLGGNTFDLYNSLDEVLLNFIEFLYEKNRNELSTLLSQIEIKEIPLDYDARNTNIDPMIQIKDVSLNVDENKNAENNYSEFEQQILNIIQTYETMLIIKPEDVMMNLMNNKITGFSFSDIHEVLYNLTTTGLLSVMYRACCHHCENDDDLCFKVMPKEDIPCPKCNHVMNDFRICFKKEK